MYAYLSLLFNICLFKKGPQDIPHSPLLLRLSIFSYSVINFLLIKVSVDTYTALLNVGAELIIIFSFSGLVLWMTNHLNRFLQTTCALLGADVLISLCIMPVIATLSIDNNNILASLSLLILMIWSWLVTAHIIRHSINKPYSFALGIVFLYIVTAYQILGALFPALNTAA